MVEPDETAPIGGTNGLTDWANPPPAKARDPLAGAAARCFATTDGAKVLAHLKAMTLDRALGPGADNAQLRHLEGQRALVAHLLALIARGHG